MSRITITTLFTTKGPSPVFIHTGPVGDTYRTTLPRRPCRRCKSTTRHPPTRIAPPIVHNSTARSVRLLLLVGPVCRLGRADSKDQWVGSQLDAARVNLFSTWLFNSFSNLFPNSFCYSFSNSCFNSFSISFFNSFSNPFFNSFSIYFPTHVPVHVSIHFQFLFQFIPQVIFQFSFQTISQFVFSLHFPNQVSI